MNTLLAVSPHLDDAVFSVGGALARRARDGWRVVVATVFTASVPNPTGFALACQLDKGLGAQVDYMALRRAEDVKACAAIGAKAIHLPFPEAPHRGYACAPALFAGRLADDGIEDAVRPALVRLIEDVRPDEVWGPLAIGNHVDHLVVRSALEAIRPPLGWWEDWPYADRADAADRRAARPIALSSDDKLAKIAGCRAYASQLGFQFGGAEAMVARLRPIDTEWLHPRPPPD